MVLGFAMCASVALAQTNFTQKVGKTEALNLKNLKQTEKVDYKASIFTKADLPYDTIQTFTFAESEMANVTIGTVGADDHIYVNGQDSVFGSDRHSVSNSNTWAKWRHYADSASFVDNYARDYTNAVVTSTGFVTSRMGQQNNPGVADDGFMFLGYVEVNNRIGNVNTYFELPAVTRPSNMAGRVVEVALTQAYYNYYDQCFIDYKIGNNWHAREINVDNIDVPINEAASYKTHYVMPTALASENSIQIRFRAYSYMRGSIYGYLWAVDNVAIMTNPNNVSWRFNSVTTLDGFYGMIPQGMQIPMTFGTNVRNTNLQDISGARLTVSTSTDRTTFGNEVQGAAVNVTAGDVMHDFRLTIDERGFIQNDADLTSTMQSWIGLTPNYGRNGLTSGYQGRSLNTETLGANYYAIKATGGSGSTARLTEFDTVLYTVTDFLEFDNENRVEGYRWGRDNGLIPSGSSFEYALTDEGFVTGDDNNPTDGLHHSWTRGYRVHMRYVTGSEIPQTNGEPWVLRGLEIVPATNRGIDSLIGAQLIPLVYEETYDVNEGYLYFTSVATGWNTSRAHVVDSTEVNNLAETFGYILPNQDYNAVNIEFVNQPELKPNTAYRFGYYLANDAAFNAAKQSYFYWENDSTGKRYADNPATANYAAQNYPSQAGYLDVIVIDGAAGDQVTAYNMEEYPMIRPIIGEASPVQRIDVTVDCTPNHTEQGEMVGFYAQYGADSICNSIVNPAVGSTVSLDLMPLGNHSFIDSVVVNGEVWEPYDETTEEGNPRLYIGEDFVVNDYHGQPDTVLRRTYYQVYLPDIEASESYVIKAYAHYERWHSNIGIDPVASDVLLTLAPNPATSTVKLNLSGVTGKAECSIIDMSGRVVYNRVINTEVENTINVSNMPAGAYFVRVTNDTFSKIEKLIIK